MKTFATIILGAVMSVLAGAALFMWQNQSSAAPTKTDFKVQVGRMAEDMQNRYVVTPTGQMWGFTPEQKIDLTVLQTKPSNIDDNMAIVAVRMSTVATVQQKDDKKSSVVQLSGIAKLTYEQIAGEWYLLDITSVNLKVAPAK